MTVMNCSEDFMDSLHLENVLNSLNDQRTQGVFCDVTIVVEDIKFKAHRNVLAASSPYFKKHFLASSICVPSCIVELNDLKADVFTEILNFMYSSKLVVKQRETLLDYVEAGKKLGIAFLENLKNDSHISKSPPSSNYSSNSDPRVSSQQFVVYPEQLKVKNSNKTSNVPAATSCPRITNAFSIVETENSNDLFSTLGLRADIKRTPPNDTKPSIVGISGIDISTNTNYFNALAEHTYAVSCVNAFFCTKLFPIHPSPLASETSKEIKQRSPSIIQATKVECATPPKKAFLKKYTCTSNTQTHTSLFNSETDNGIAVTPAFNTCIGMDFQLSSEKESSPLLSIPTDATGTGFLDDHVLPSNHSLHSESSQTPYKCKNCNKPFTNDKRLARHEQICLRPVHLLAQSDDPYRFRDNCFENNMKENVHSSQIPSLSTSEMNTVSTEGSEGQEADHFVKIVNEQRFYICIVCQRHYATLSSLRRHANVHSWRKTYPCHYCNQVFALAEYRTKHEIWHTGDRRYQCIFCLETFMTYYILKNHQKSFHGIDPRLGISRKTANGRLKSSLYPYKLYRLLPMKGKRTSFKDLLNGVSKVPELSLHDVETISHLGISQTSVNSEQSAFFRDRCEALKSTNLPIDRTPCKESSATCDSCLPEEPQCLAQPSMCETLVPVFEKKFKSSCKEQKKSAGQNVNIMSSTNSPSSLTGHRSRASSLIMHGNETESFTSNESETFIGVLSKDIKEEKNNEVDKFVTIKSEATEVSPKIHEKRESSTAFLKKTSNIDQDDSKTVTYIAKPALPKAFINSGVEPLCKITVRIGSEAMMRRHIPGSDLFPKRDQTRQNEKRDEQDCKTENGERGSGRLRRMSKSIRMNEIFDDESDQDSKDKSWRPYGKDKHKKRSKHLKKIHKRKKRKKHDKREPKSEGENVIEMVNVLEQTPTEENSKENIKDEAVHEEKQDTHDFISNSDVCSSKFEENAGQWHVPSSASFCELCQKQFRNMYSLKVHMRSHTGEKPYSCKTCGKCFSFLGNLRKHEQIHLGIKNFICQHCNKAFTLNETLKKHEMIHTREKQYQCQFCPKSFSYILMKKNHEQKHELEKGLKGYVCHQCSRVCKTADALSMHLKMHYLKKLQRWAGKEGRTEQCRKLPKYIMQHHFKGINHLRWPINSTPYSFSEFTAQTNILQDNSTPEKGTEVSSSTQSPMHEQPKKGGAVVLSMDFVDGDSLKQSPKHKTWDCWSLAESGSLNCEINSIDINTRKVSKDDTLDKQSGGNY